MKKLIIGNWKMNPSSLRAAIRLAKQVDLPGAVIAPPFVFLESVGKVLRKAALASQDVYWNSEQRGGAATGEISIRMLKSMAARYVIVGHSERRQILGETDAMVRRKLEEVIRNGMYAVVYVGEPGAIHRKGLRAAMRYVSAQLRKDFAGIKKLKKAKTKLIIAYEPIWAIGTGASATPRDVSNMVLFIKKTFSKTGFHPRVLYGGSVTSRNIKEFLTAEGVDGALVGGASIRTPEFRRIWKIARMI